MPCHARKGAFLSISLQTFSDHSSDYSYGSLLQNVCLTTVKSKCRVTAFPIGGHFVIFHLKRRFVLVVHLLAAVLGFPATVNPSNEDAAARGNVPTLSSLIQRAIATHSLVEEGRANLQAEGQAVKTAKWQHFLTPGVSYDRAFVDCDGYTTVLSLSSLCGAGRFSDSPFPAP